MSRAPWILLGLASLLLVAGFWRIDGTSERGEVSPGNAVAPPEFLAATPEQRARRLSGALRYVRWVLDNASADLDQLGAARSLCHQAGLACALPGVAGPGTAQEVTVLGVRVEDRFQHGIREAWFSCRRSLALRDWARARATLKGIQRAVNDPRSADHRRAAGLPFRRAESPHRRRRCPSILHR